MIRSLYRASLALAMSLPLLGGSHMPAAAAGSAAQNASITIGDSGYNPRSVTVALNGSVSFTNAGSNIHTATTTGGAPLPFDTGGLAPSQTTSFTLTLPGVYGFNSATDCLNGNNNPQFNCGGGSVTVVDNGAAPAAPTAPAPAPAAAAPPPGAPAPAGAAQTGAVVTITDSGISPGSVDVALGGSVTWVNNSSSTVHTATSNGGTTPVPFDTGGLGPGQSNTLSFATPGQYAYTSATDCIGNSSPGFNCGPYYVNVGATPGAPAPIAAAPAPGAPSAAPAPAVVSNTNVTIDESGFNPSTLTIRAGQTVTWTNTGTAVHTVTSNPGYFNAFDSGGLDKGQKYSYNFTLPGTYGYHSDTEPVYGTDNLNNVTKGFRFNGTIVVQ